MSAQMTHTNLQTNGSSLADTTRNFDKPTTATHVTPVTAGDDSNIDVNNSGSVPHPRTGIPRYAIPYRRPETRPSIENSIDSPTSPAASESTSSCQQDIPRGRNGLRTGSIGENNALWGSGPSSSYRYGRAVSVDPLRGDSESEHSSVFSSSGQPRQITSKISSLANANYKPGGGNVKIFTAKVEFKDVQSKCNSKANLKHKPGGGDVQIVDKKLTFKDNIQPLVNSMANAKHVPGGGNVKIDSCKLDFNETAASRVGSLQNASHTAGGGNVKIFNEKLPWLKYNKPNLPPTEKAKINKHTPLASDASNEPIYTSRHSSTTS